MSSNGIRDRVAIIGVGCTRFGERWDVGPDELIVDAAHEALACADIGLDQVDAFWLGTSFSGQSGMTAAAPLKITGKPVTRVENLCATGSEALRNACYGVASGAYDVAMALGVEKLKDSGLSGLAAPPLPSDGTRVDLSPPAMFSLLGPAYAKKYEVPEDTLKDVFTHIAWRNHRNGAMNPRAQFRQEVSREKIKSAPPIAGNLGVYDCSGVADGAAAAIIVRAEDAARFQEEPLYVKALSCVAGAATGPIDSGYDYTTFDEVVASAEDAYRQAGIESPAEELALAEVHDCFTPTELILMEDLGFAPRGSGWREVLDGKFDLDGQLPVNPDGGLKSFGHPIGASGLRMVFEIWLQLRGEAGDRQVGNGRKLGLSHNLGGMPGAAVSFVGIFGSDSPGRAQ
jgi:acetyl-CoA C-acetyltransferase